MDVNHPDRDGDSVAGLWQIATSAATVGIFCLLFLAFLDLARNILLPVTTALVIGIVLDPLVRRAEQVRIPPPAFAAAIVGILLAATYVGMVVLSGQITTAIDRAPEMASAVRNKFSGVDFALSGLRQLQEALGMSADLAGPRIDLAEIVKPVLAFLTPAIGELLVFFTTLFLFLIDRTLLRRKLILVFSRQQTRLRAIHVLNEIERGLARYLGAVTVINLVVGTLTALLLSWFGFPNPVFWGMIAFVANFVPYLGPGLMSASIFVTGVIILPTLGHAMLAAGLFVGLTALEGHFVTPTVIGHNFRMSALAAFLSLAFWTWLWGPVGAFLAIPLLIVATIVLADLLPENDIELPE